MQSTFRWRLLAVAVLVGAVLAVLGDLVLYTVDDTCPQWEDEGPMAAERSPYSVLMCNPSSLGSTPLFDGPPLVLVVPLAVLAGLLLALLLGRRRSVGRGRVAASYLVGVFVPVLLIGLLHLALPRYCLTGSPDSPGCVRDREQR